MRRSIGRTLRSYCKKKFLGQISFLSENENDIVILSSFIFVSCSLMCRKGKEEYMDFDWKPYFRSFSFKHLDSFIICAIRYLLDNGKISKDKEPLIRSNFRDIKSNFREQYIYSLVYRKAKELDENVDFDSYIALLDIALKINGVHKNEIPKDSSRVMRLVSYSSEWKKRAFKLFGNKAEYVNYAFFVNLDK
ncbi:hypothetical protein A6V39_02115 [Candidatus Mycoplasma haematobovis]|uniref:Uncharacterized protein n=1 Tax=Candidatus Mycoplasma haematobovis TaxID=432608 RepID=A0A1A9QEP9_9MOLU|nr:hypothetical protein [Candidatus Mycoplasma haematobovis]OAL10426.1 hypothetical protein A6V39_02115 [Candidatus Mycoplasma haematobovis]